MVKASSDMTVEQRLRQEALRLAAYEDGQTLDQMLLRARKFYDFLAGDNEKTDADA